ncbi:hypothetical protein D4R42_04690 [bacterium]|nr:MAG: hypothetical protein D4R42_04690 [bacterium]
MQYAIIPNDKTLELANMGDIHFVLAHRVFESDKYANFFARSNKYKIMDNGAFELKKSLDVEELVTAAKMIGANELVAMDKPSDPADSYEMTKQYIEEIVDLGLEKEYKLHVVPHGETMGEYVEYYKKCLQLGPDVIGFSILDLWKWHPYMRPFVINMLYHERYMPAGIEYHLLGLDLPHEIFCYGSVPIRSVDTSMPFSKAYYGQALFGPDTMRIPKDAKLDKKQTTLAKFNIRKLLEICHDYGHKGLQVDLL